MTNFKLLAAGVLLTAVSATAFAENGLTVGAGVGVGKSPYKQYDNDAFPVPDIDYDSDHFWWHGLGGGYYLWNDESDKLSVTGFWDPMRFKPSDSDNRRLRQLDKRRSTVMAGLSYQHFTQYGFLRTTLAGDVLDNSNGFIWDLAWLYRYTNGGLTVTPASGLSGTAKTRTTTTTAFPAKSPAAAALTTIMRMTAGTPIWSCRLTTRLPAAGAFSLSVATPA